LPRRVTQPGGGVGKSGQPAGNASLASARRGSPRPTTGSTEHAARLLAELEPDVRELIIARLWGGLTYEEAARLQGCSLTTAHRRYQAGLARLHERLEARWNSTNSTATTKTKTT
jgi:DNA-directed RNA polymerase specialized sigma24 family protein